MADFDLITDILQRIAAKGVAVPRTVAHAVDMEARREWGGKRHYILRHGEPDRIHLDQHIQQRDEAIAAAWRAGETLGHLAQRWNLSRRRIRQIIRSTQAPA